MELAYLQADQIIFKDCQKEDIVPLLKQHFSTCFISTQIRV